MTTHLILIRHGQPAGRERGGTQRMSGWTDVPLSPTGREQIALLAGRLQAQEAIFAAIYTSPLQRAAATAAAISRSARSPVAKLDELKEINCGDVDGRSVEDVKTRHCELWQANLRQDNENFRWPGGESYREFRDRCLAAIVAVTARQAGERVAVVTHAGVISQIAGYLHGLSAAQWEPFRPGTASLNEFEWAGNSGKVLTFDDRAHLQPSSEEPCRTDSVKLTTTARPHER